MIDLNQVMAKTDQYYAEIKAERLQCDISLVPQQIQSDQIRALAKALVEEINGFFQECDEVEDWYKYADEVYRQSLKDNEDT